jgi:hypothetical protein
MLFGSDYSGENTALNQVVPYIRTIAKLLNKQEQKNAFNGLAVELFFKS